MRTILLILVPLILLAVSLTSQYLLLERLFILVVALLFFNLLIALSGIWGIKGRMLQPSPYQQAGKAFFSESIVENSSKLSKPFLGLKVKSDIRRSQNKSILIQLASKGNYNWRAPITFPCRGNYKIGPLVAEATDPFGLFHIQKKLDSEKTVLIYPSLVELPFFALLSQQESSPLRYSRMISESGSLMAGVRDYIPGDSLSRIHWRSTAHRGKLVVKEYDLELDKKIWILLDLSKNHVYGTGVETTEEYSITIAASILKKFCDAGQQVGLIAQGSHYYFFPPRSGSPHAWRILETMAVMKADGHNPMSRLIDRAYEQLDQNSVAVIVSACTDEDLTESVIRIRKRGIEVTAILLDNFSFGGQSVPDQAAKLLRSVDIPTHIVKMGANLSETLNNQKININ